jgi:hypothetical protein
MSRNFELMQRATSSRIEVRSERSEIVKPAGIVVARQASLRPAVEAFFRQWKLFAATVFAILFATVLFALLSHKQYMSEMKFLVQNARENVVVTPERTNATNNVVSWPIRAGLRCRCRSAPQARCELTKSCWGRFRSG